MHNNKIVVNVVHGGAMFFCLRIGDGCGRKEKSSPPMQVSKQHVEDLSAIINVTMYTP